MFSRFLILASTFQPIGDTPPLPVDTLPAALVDSSPFGLPPLPHAHEAGDAALAALGRSLFFDPILSRDRSVSCASCHDPAHGFARPDPRAIGIGGHVVERNAPSLLNRAFGTSFAWDGRFASLAEQALDPIKNPDEMDLAIPAAVARLAADPGYAARFGSACGGPPTAERLEQALASFESRLVLGDSPVDRFRANDYGALDESERAGFWTWESKGRCWRCHSGPNFTDELFHNTGVAERNLRGDVGRAKVTGDANDTGAFKTPTLRGVALTAPYMHDGSLATLEDVIDFYGKGGGDNPHLDSRMAPIEFSAQERADLVKFLQALSRTGD